jgi:hypothetical protein
VRRSIGSAEVERRDKDGMGAGWEQQRRRGRQLGVPASFREDAE